MLKGWGQEPKVKMKPWLAMGGEAAPYEEFYGHLCRPVSPLFLEG